MNWYKTAKLIDKKHHTDQQSIFSQCSYCNRWAIHDEFGRTQWTTDLDPEEKTGLAKGHISHGICPKCWAIMENHGLSIDPEEIGKMSLATTSK